MRSKIFVFTIGLLLIISGTLVVFGGEANLDEEEKIETVLQSEFIDVTEFNVPEEVVKGETEPINATVESLVAEDNTTAYIYVDYEEELNETIEPEEEVLIGSNYTFNKAGEIEVEVRDEENSTVESKTVTVVDTYELEVNIEGNGTVEIDPDQGEYEEGTEVNLTAIPDDHWYFVEWTGDHTGDEEQINITMDEDKNITAWFAEKEHDLTVNIEGEGTVTDHEGFEFEDGDTKNYTEMTEVNLTADAGEHWYFVNWTGDHEGTEEEITVTMDGDKSLTAVFEEYRYTLEVDVEGSGTVEIDPDEDEYEPGTEVNLTADAGEHWYFVEWSGDHTGTEEEITVTMNEDKSLTAVFEEYRYTLEVEVEGSGTVEIEPEEDEYEPGTEVNLTALPDEHWYFVEWSGDHTGTEEEITVTMDGDKNLTAVFEEYRYTLEVEVEGSGSVEIDPDEDEYEPGTEVNLTADAGEHWYFVNWTGDHEGTEEEITVTMNEDKSLTAIFEEFRYTLEVEVEGNGTVEIEPDEEEYEPGTEVNLTADAGEFWEFIEWSGDEAGTDPTIGVTMDANKEITAHFERKDPELILKNWSVSPEVVEPGETVTIEGVVENIGGELGEDSVDFCVDDQDVDYEHVELDSGESITVTFEYGPTEEIGTYQVRVEFYQHFDDQWESKFEVVGDIFTLTIDASSGGTTAPEPGEYPYAQGEEVNVEALPDDGYLFSGWTGDVVSEERTIDVLMDGDKEIRANFEEERPELILRNWSVDPEVVGPGETVTVEGVVENMGTDTGRDSVDFYVDDMDNYEDFEHVELDPGESTTVTFRYSGTENIGTYQVRVEFYQRFDDHWESEFEVTDEDLDRFELTIDLEGEGTTSPEEGNHTYTEGEEVTVTATAAEGWVFVQWTGDHEGTSEEITVTMDSDKRVTAHFEEDIDKYEVIMHVEGQGRVTIEVMYEGDWSEIEGSPIEGEWTTEELGAAGTEVRLTADPEENHEFVGWQGVPENVDESREQIELILLEDMDITANFQEIDEDEEDGMNYWWILGMIVIVVLLVVITGIMYKRKESMSDEGETSKEAAGEDMFDVVEEELDEDEVVKNSEKLVEEEFFGEETEE